MQVVLASGSGRLIGGSCKFQVAAYTLLWGELNHAQARFCEGDIGGNGGCQDIGWATGGIAGVGSGPRSGAGTDASASSRSGCAGAGAVDAGIAGCEAVADDAAFSRRGGANER